MVDVLGWRHRRPPEFGLVHTYSSEDLRLMTREQPHAEGVRPDFGQAIPAEHLGREILDVVRHYDSGLGDDRRRDTMGILPLGCRPNHALKGGNQR